MSQSQETTPPMQAFPELHPDLVNFMSEVRTELRDVKHAVVGSQYQKGLLTEHEELKIKVESHDRKIWFVTTLGIGITTAIGLLKDYFRHPPQ